MKSHVMYTSEHAQINDFTYTPPSLSCLHTHACISQEIHAVFRCMRVRYSAAHVFIENVSVESVEAGQPDILDHCIIHIIVFLLVAVFKFKFYMKLVKIDKTR